MYTLNVSNRWLGLRLEFIGKKQKKERKEMKKKREKRKEISTNKL